jgi:hypothetical protein
MAVSLENGILVLPSGLPGYETSGFGQDKTSEGIGIGAAVFLTIPGLQVQLRLHDYFMGKVSLVVNWIIEILMSALEMSLNVDTVSGHIEPNCPELVTYECHRHKKTKEILFVDSEYYLATFVQQSPPFLPGIDITANRLFGPQPRTATYLCIWEVHLGHIKAIFSASDGWILAAAGNAFRLNFADYPNAPAAEYLLPIDPDGKMQSVIGKTQFLLGIQSHSLNLLWIPSMQPGEQDTRP